MQQAHTGTRGHHPQNNLNLREAVQLPLTKDCLVIDELNPHQTHGQKKQGRHRHQQSQQFGGFGPAITLPLLQKSNSGSRNPQLGMAKTQKTPKHGGSKDRCSSTASGQFASDFGRATQHHQQNHPGVGAQLCQPPQFLGGALGSSDQSPHTPQKVAAQGMVHYGHNTVAANSASKHLGRSAQQSSKLKTASRKGTKGKSSGAQPQSNNHLQNHNNYQLQQQQHHQQHVQSPNGPSSTTSAFKQQSVAVVGNQFQHRGATHQHPHQQQHVNDFVAVRENNLQSSEKKVNKYDKMLQSLEAVATKQRNQTNTFGSAPKTITSTEATNDVHQQDTRLGALSISSCISKNTGSNTMVAREKLAQLQIQQQQQQLQLIKQTIFDRNRPWNCDYCQPKTSPQPLVDKQLEKFSRGCVSKMVSRFMIKEEFYESRKVVELLNTNSRSVLVAQFKDFLIYDDIYEFLTSVYDLRVSLDILTRHAVFYDSLSSLEVLCQYREDQIRDRHLVLFGLKPCYISLEKQIQGTIASNLRNKLRLVLSQVRKVQHARGIKMNESDVGDSSVVSTPIKTDPAASPSRIPTSTEKKRHMTSNKKNFKKMIHSTMVQAYNFSRCSQSGILMGRDVTGLISQDVMRLNDNTHSSINFTNISVHNEVELLKGSVFEEDSMERLTDSFFQQQDVENIESNYMNAQMILDDLSSRPLTRQSMPKTNVATPASRIQMYELRKQAEEQKTRLNFQMAPEKPTDQKSCSDSNEGANSLLQVSKGEIMIINEGADNGHRYSQHCTEPQKNERNYGREDDLQITSTCLRQELPLITVATIDQQNYRPITLAPLSNELSLRCSIQSLDSQSMKPVSTGYYEETGIGGTMPRDEELRVSGPSATVEYTGSLNNNIMTQNSCHGYSVRHQRTIKKSMSSKKKSEHSNSNVANSRTISSSFKQQTTSRQLRDGNTAVPNTQSRKSRKKPSLLKDAVLLTETCGQDTNRSNAQHSSKVGAKAGQTGQGRGRGTPHGKITSLTKESPAEKQNFTNFTLQQHKLMAGSSKTLGLQHNLSGAKGSFGTSTFLSKKASVPSFTGRGSLAFSNGLAAREHHHNSASKQKQATLEAHENDKIKVSKNLIASIKSNIHLQQQMQTQQIANNLHLFVDQGEDQQRRLSPQLPPAANQRRPAVGQKGLAPAKTMSHLGVKAVSLNQNQRASCAATTSKNSKIAQSQKRNHEQRTNQLTKDAKMGTAQRKNANVFSSEKPSIANLQLSQDNKLTQQHPQTTKNQLSLKEQVILEAIRKDHQQSSNVLSPSGATAKRNASSGHQQQFLTQQVNAQSQVGDPQAIKLLRSQQLTASGGGILATSKSLIAQKVDLYSIAGKLKLLGPQQVATKGSHNVLSSANVQQQQQQQQQQPSSRQRLTGGSSGQRKNSIKFNSRKVSIEQRDEIQFSRGNSSQKQQHQTLRFFSADAHAKPEKNTSEQEQTTTQTTSIRTAKEKVNSSSKVASVAKRKLVQPGVGLSKTDAYYSQRNHHQIHQTSAGGGTFQMYAPGGHDMAVSSRNGQLFGDHGSVDQLNLVTKTLNELQKQHTHASRGGNASGQKVTSQKKKISKLSRAVTGPVLSPANQKESVVDAPIVSPRKLMKDSEHHKTRNSNLIGGSQTQSQQRLVALNQLGFQQSSNNGGVLGKQKTLTTSQTSKILPQNGQMSQAASTFHRLQQCSSFNNNNTNTMGAAEQQQHQTLQLVQHHQASRNQGLPVPIGHHSHNVAMHNHQSQQILTQHSTGVKQQSLQHQENLLTSKTQQQSQSTSQMTLQKQMQVATQHANAMNQAAQFLSLTTLAQGQIKNQTQQQAFSQYATVGHPGGAQHTGQSSQQQQLKQEAKLHSRKNSAVYSLAQAQKAGAGPQQSSQPQHTTTGGLPSERHGTKSFGGSGATTTTHKKSKKKVS